MNRLVTSDLQAGQALQDVAQWLDAEYDIEGRPVQYVEGGGEQAYAVTAPDTEVAGSSEGTGYQALVNPAWEGQANASTRPGDTPVWHIATERYTPVSPMAKFGPLLAALRANGQDTASLFGEVRLFRNGGEVHADLWLPGLTVDLAGETYILGLQAGYDYFGGTALYARLLVGRQRDGTILRHLTNKRRRAHRGSAQEDVAEWWQSLLGQASEATDTLRRVVAQAQAYTVDFEGLPITAEQYLLARFDGTASYAEEAVARLPGTTPVSEVSAWHLYSAMAETLTHEFQGKDESSALRRYTRRATGQVFDPQEAEREVMRWLEQSEELAGQTTLDGDSVVATLREHRLDLDEAVSEYEETKATLKRLLEADEENED
jgi:hypothetical protein